jgi:hypothetical protein
LVCRKVILITRRCRKVTCSNSTWFVLQGSDRRSTELCFLQGCRDSVHRCPHLSTSHGLLDHEALGRCVGGPWLDEVDLLWLQFVQLLSALCGVETRQMATCQHGFLFRTLMLWSYSIWWCINSCQKHHLLGHRQ